LRLIGWCMTSHDCHELLLRLRFGPSFLTELICPLLTSVAESERITSSLVTIPWPTTDLPR